MISAADLMTLPPIKRHYEFLGGHLLVYWGGYEYPIELGRIDTPLKALAWLHHLGRKEWALADTEQFALLIEDLAKRFNWSLLT